MWRGWFFLERFWQVSVSVGWAAELQFDSWRCGYGSRSRTHGCWFESLHSSSEPWFNSVASFLYTLRRCEDLGLSLRMALEEAKCNIFTVRMHILGFTFFDCRSLPLRGFYPTELRIRRIQLQHIDWSDAIRVYILELWSIGLHFWVEDTFFVTISSSCAGFPCWMWC